MVLNITYTPRLIQPDLMDAAIDKAKSTASAGLAFVVAAPKNIKMPSMPPRGVFRPPLGKPPLIEPPVPNPYVVALMLAITLWEAYQTMQEQTPTSIPAIDRPPLGVDVDQWRRDMDDMSRIAAEVVTLQHQIQLFDEWNMSWVADMLREQMATLIADAQKIVTHYPVEGHHLQAMASAGTDVASSDASAGTATTEIEARDWQDLAQDAKQRDAFFRRVRHAVAARIDRGDYDPSILAWYEATVVPQLQQIQRILGKQAEQTDLGALLVAIPMYLQSRQVDTVRRFCVPAANDLLAIFDDLQAQYPGQMIVAHPGFASLRLATTVDLNQFEALLEKMMHNAVTHPRDSEKAVQVRWEIVHGALFMRSDDQQDELATEWDDIQYRANQLGLDIEIKVAEQKGARVVLILPTGFMELDPLQHVLTGRGNIQSIRIAISEMTPDQRIAALQEMRVVSQRVEDQVLSQAMDILAVTARHRFLLELRVTAVRFEQMVRLLSEELPPQDRLVREIMDLVKQLKVQTQYPGEFF